MVEEKNSVPREAETGPGTSIRLEWRRRSVSLQATGDGDRRGGRNADEACKNVP